MFLKKNRPDQKRSGRFFLIFLIQVSGGDFQFFTGLTAPENAQQRLLCAISRFFQLTNPYISFTKKIIKFTTTGR